MGGNAIYPPTGIENVGPTPGTTTMQPGTFYIDKLSRVLSYAPRRPDLHAPRSRSPPTSRAAGGEEEESPPAEMADVVLPLAEQLVVGAGTKAAPIAGVRFEAIRFESTTWGRPAGLLGYVEIQSGKIIDGYGWPGASCPGLQPVPGAVAFHNATGIAVDRCEFARLGTAGVTMSTRAQRCVVGKSYFHDLSGGAVDLGVYSWTDPGTGAFLDAPVSQDPRDWDRDNVVANNTVVGVGVEFRGSAGIAAGYTAGTAIVANEVDTVPNTAISVGWGWGRGANRTALETMMRDNRVAGNKCHGYKRVLNDGGCVCECDRPPCHPAAPRCAPLRPVAPRAGFP